MSWVPWWGWVVAGLASYLPAWRVCFRWMILDACGSYDKVQGLDLFMGLFLGGLTAFMFPLMLIGLFLRWLVDGRASDIARRIGGETRDQKQVRKERDLKDRERHIEQLERELGIS